MTDTFFSLDVKQFSLIVLRLFVDMHYKGQNVWIWIGLHLIDSDGKKTHIPFQHRSIV